VPISEDQVLVLAALAEIEITPGQMPGVIQNLETVLAQAALLFDPPIDPLLEPAPVFVP
jgi:Asp-tRNA(Asn)/Glu-tRNA(Gln) amidotransferase C subunit